MRQIEPTKLEVDWNRKITVEISLKELAMFCSLLGASSSYDVADKVKRKFGEDMVDKIVDMGGDAPQVLYEETERLLKDQGAIFTQ